MPQNIHLKHVDNIPMQTCIVVCYFCAVLSLVISNYFSLLALIPLAAMYANGLDENTSKHFIAIISILSTRIYLLISTDK